LPLTCWTCDTMVSIETIVSQVQQVNGNVEAIVEAAKEQATGIKEINQAVNMMDQGTQQNAAMVEESTAASHSLAKEADALFQLLSQFSIGNTAASRHSRPAAATVASRPVASPARTMAAKVTAAFHGNVAVAGSEWEEFGSTGRGR